jgi:hypothetical protein
LIVLHFRPDSSFHTGACSDRPGSRGKVLINNDSPF